MVSISKCPHLKPFFLPRCLGSLFTFHRMCEPMHWCICTCYALLFHSQDIQSRMFKLRVVDRYSDLKYLQYGSEFLNVPVWWIVSHLFLTGDMHEEVENHNRVLDRMGNEMDSSRGILSGTMDRFKMVFETKSSRRMLTLVASFVVIFLVVYYLTK
ncbi:hypothetical protein MKW92_045927 [Papaver armeniacum]|nr:hypothetical protein MKW92_045927 [Papaver armeniacum]